MGWPSPPLLTLLTPRLSGEIPHELIHHLILFLSTGRTLMGASSPSTVLSSFPGLGLFVFSRIVLCTAPWIPFIEHGETSGELWPLLIKLLC